MIGKLNVRTDLSTVVLAACIVFVFGAMLEYSGILLLLKLEKMNIKPLQAYFQVDNSGNKFPKAVYWTCILFTFYLESTAFQIFGV